MQPGGVDDDEDDSAAAAKEEQRRRVVDAVRDLCWACCAEGVSSGRGLGVVVYDET
jgi:hypothetical protein